MILLDPAIEVGVIRGGVVDHPRYPGTRVFGSGLNLTRLFHGRIDFLFYLLRDLGYVHKIYRGITGAEGGAAGRGGADAGRPGGHAGARAGVATRRADHEKLWIAAVERLAVGGACQLLHVVDHVIATRGSRLFLPPARRASSRARPTSACPGSSVIAPPGRRSSPAGNGSRASRTRRCSVMRWWNPARWTGRSRPGSMRSPTRDW